MRVFSGWLGRAAVAVLAILLLWPQRSARQAVAIDVVAETR